MRFVWVFCVIIGAGFVVLGGVCGVRAAGQAAEMSAYQHARPCLAGAAPDAACLQPADGTVSGVVEISGKNAEYALEVQTASATLNLSFTSDSPLLGYATDGDPAVVTMWRGIPVSVSADGRSEPTAAVPRIVFAKDLGECGQAGGVGVLLLFGAAAGRRNRFLGRPRLARPVVAAVSLGLGLGAFVVMIAGFALSGHPSGLGAILPVAGGALAVVAGLSVLLGLSVRRQAGQRAPGLAARPQTAPDEAGTHAPSSAIPRRTVLARSRRRAVPLGARPRAMSLLTVLSRRAARWAVPVLTVAVLAGIGLATQDGTSARAYRHAPACAGETNLSACAGDFTATVNGVRTMPGNGSYADVSYVTADGVINNWARFDGNGAALAGTAEADQDQRTPLTIRVWRGSIVGGQLGSTWLWAEGNPPGAATATVFLAVSFALLLLLARLRIRRRSVSRAAGNRRGLILAEAGQTAVAAGGVVLLAYGLWPGAIVAVAALAWLGLSAWRSRPARGRGLLASLPST